jgi:nucleotide-binding universal stress UspA family protein
VVRAAPCPVVTTRAHPESHRPLEAGESSTKEKVTEIRTILVPTDFSDISEAALAYGCAMAERLGARVHVLAVVESPWARDFAYVPPAAEMIEDLRQRAESKLSHAVESSRPGVIAGALVRTGEPFDQIIRAAEELDADLIVMGTHTRGLASRLLLGSITQKVLHAAACPVVTLREHRAGHNAPPEPRDSTAPFDTPNVSKTMRTGA